LQQEYLIDDTTVTTKERERERGRNLSIAYKKMITSSLLISKPTDLAAEISGANWDLLGEGCLRNTDKVGKWRRIFLPTVILANNMNSSTYVFVYMHTYTTYIIGRQ
jgi:hypothetical protein